MKTYRYVENILSSDRQDYIEEYAKSTAYELASIVTEGGKQKGYNIPFINAGILLKRSFRNLRNFCTNHSVIKIPYCFRTFLLNIIKTDIPSRVFQK